MAVRTRWLRFNAVGALGVGVQLAVLTVLVRALGWHPLWATAAAVETAVLHNFCLHECWTWRDRGSRSASGVAYRLLVFHMLNGTISHAGNIALVALFGGALGVDPVVASLIAIAVCSVANFAAGEWWIFTRAAAVALLVLAAEPFAAAPGAAEARAGHGAPSAQLQPATRDAWVAYADRVNSRFDAASPDSTPFFALDAFGRGPWRDAATAGQVPAFRIDRPRPDDPDVTVPGGKIHHWAGAVFLPDTTPAAALDRVMRLAGQESAHYEDVLASKLLAKKDTSARVFMKLRRTKVVTVTYNTEHSVEYRRLGDRRAAVRSVATRIAELDDAGTPREREQPPGSDRGYLWRLNAYWRYEAFGTGVLIECESVTLSRSVPVLLRPLIGGIVDGLARESLERTLLGLRRALGSAMGADGRQGAAGP